MLLNIYHSCLRHLLRSAVIGYVLWITPSYAEDMGESPVAEVGQSANSEPVASYNREQSTLKNDAYKQFIKLQVSLAAGTKNSLGLSSYE